MIQGMQLYYEVQKRNNQLLIYTGDTFHHQAIGYLQVVDDENCCGATCNFQYMFQTENDFWMMSQDELSKEFHNFKTWEGQ